MDMITEYKSIMHFKKQYHILFVYFLLSVMTSQSLLNRAIGEELEFGSARSYGMGLTHALNADNTSLLRFNPSRLSSYMDENFINYDFQIFSSSILERRSMMVKDYFGDFLTYADYVYNQNILTNFYGGMAYNPNNNLSLAISFIPVTNFSYYYEEEVRGSNDVEEGDIGIRDPIVGYHILENEGQLNSLSIGSSFYINHNTSDEFSMYLGWALHNLMDFTISDEIYVDVISNNSDNLSTLISHDELYDINNIGSFLSIGVTIETNTIHFGISHESSLSIDYDYENFNYMDSIGVISYLDNLGQNYTGSGFGYFKPPKYCLAISYKPLMLDAMTISFEIDYNVFSNRTDYSNLFNDQRIFKFGFEYFLSNSRPLRAGIVYKTSAVALIPPTSIITFGTGGRVWDIFYDLGVSYSSFEYFYPDLFPILNDIRDDNDRISESNINFILSLKYNIK